MDRSEKLARYAALVRAWAGRLNLVSSADLPRLEERHLEDSLRALPLVDEAPEGPCVDVGSGAGLPGIPLAICRPQRSWRLIEPRRQRVAFLEEVVRSLELPNVTVHALTAEAAARRWPQRHSLGVARALASPERAIELVGPLVAPEGIVTVFLGEHSRLPPGAQEWAEGLAIVRTVHPG